MKIVKLVCVFLVSFATAGLFVRLAFAANLPFAVVLVAALTFAFILFLCTHAAKQLSEWIGCPSEIIKLYCWVIGTGGISGGLQTWIS